jgi:hypothetical protein
MVPLVGKAHCFDWHSFDRHTIGRVNTALMLGLIGSGLVACALGAFIYDVSRLIAVW